MWLEEETVELNVTHTYQDCIYTALLSKALYDLPLVHPFPHTLTHRPMAASYHAKYPNHQEQFRSIVLFKDMWRGGASG